MASIFISYKRKDIDFAFKVEAFLQENGYFTFLDKRSILGGKEWKRVIDKALRDCFAVIVIVTPEALQSMFVTYEWSFALGLGKTVIPITLQEPTMDAPMHPRLDDHQRRNFSDSDPEKHEWNELLADIMAVEREQSVPSSIKNAERTLRRDFRLTHWKQAIAHLEQHPHERATKVLADCAEELSYDVAIPCALALARKAPGDPHGTRALGRAIQDHTYESKGSRNEAVNALARIGSPEAAEYLIAAAQPGMSDTHFLNVLLSVIRQLNYQIVYDFFRSIIEADIHVWSFDHRTIAVQTLTATRDSLYVNSILKILYMEHSWQHTTKAVIESLATLMSPEDFANEIVKAMDTYSDGYWKQHNATDQRTRELLQSIIDVDGEATSQALKILANTPKMRYLHQHVQQELFRRSQLL